MLNKEINQYNMNMVKATLDRRGASITVLRLRVGSTTYLLLSITYQLLLTSQLHVASKLMFALSQ
jgi:hypothetical protein